LLLNGGKKNMARHRIYRRYGRRHTRHTHHSETHGIIPVTIGAAAAAIPFLSNNTGTGISVMEDLLGNLQNAQYGQPVQLQYVGPELVGAIKNNIGEIVELGILAGAFAWGARKFKLNKVTKVSKKWSLF